MRPQSVPIMFAACRALSLSQAPPARCPTASSTRLGPSTRCTLVAQPSPLAPPPTQAGFARPLEAHQCTTAPGTCHLSPLEIAACLDCPRRKASQWPGSLAGGAQSMCAARARSLTSCPLQTPPSIKLVWHDLVGDCETLWSSLQGCPSRLLALTALQFHLSPARTSLPRARHTPCARRAVLARCWVCI